MCNPGVPVVTNFGSLGKELSRGHLSGLSGISVLHTRVGISASGAACVAAGRSLELSGAGASLVEQG